MLYGGSIQGVYVHLGTLGRFDHPQGLEGMSESSGRINHFSRDEGLITCKTFI